MKSVLKEAIEDNDRWIKSLKHFAEVEGHHNIEVMMVVSFKIDELEMEQEKLIKKLEEQQ